MWDVLQAGINPNWEGGSLLNYFFPNSKQKLMLVKTSIRTLCDTFWTTEQELTKNLMTILLHELMMKVEQTSESPWRQTTKAWGRTGAAQPWEVAIFQNKLVLHNPVYEMQVEFVVWALKLIMFWFALFGDQLTPCLLTSRCSDQTEGWSSQLWCSDN